MTDRDHQLEFEFKYAELEKQIRSEGKFDFVKASAYLAEICTHFDCLVNELYSFTIELSTLGLRQTSIEISSKVHHRSKESGIRKKNPTQSLEEFKTIDLQVGTRIDLPNNSYRSISKMTNMAPIGLFGQGRPGPESQFVPIVDDGDVLDKYSLKINCQSVDMDSREIVKIVWPEEEVHSDVDQNTNQIEVENYIENIHEGSVYEPTPSPSHSVRSSPIFFQFQFPSVEQNSTNQTT